MFSRTMPVASSVEPKQLTLLLAAGLVLSVLQSPFSAQLLCHEELLSDVALLELPRELQDMPTTEQFPGVATSLDNLSYSYLVEDLDASNSADLGFQSPVSRAPLSVAFSPKLEQAEESDEDTCASLSSMEAAENRDTVSMVTLFVAGAMTKLLSRFLASEQLIWVAAA